MKQITEAMKDFCAGTIGRFISRTPVLSGYKKRLLATWFGAEKRTLIDACIYPPLLRFWFNNEYLQEPDPEVREAMKSILMGGGNSARMARYYDAGAIELDAGIGSMAYREAYPLLPYIDSRLEKIGKGCVVQIGSSSGRETAWLASRHQCASFIGTDVYPAAVDFAKRTYSLENLDFDVCDARAAATRLAGDQPYEVVSSGSLQYVQPEHMAAVFLSAAQAGAALTLVEPADKLAGDPTALKGSRWRGNLTFTHDYRWYGEAAGLTTEICEVIEPYAGTSRASTVHYFYRGVPG